MPRLLPPWFLTIGLLALGAFVPCSAQSADLPDVQNVRAAVEDLAAGFGKRYPRAKEFLDRLDRLQQTSDPDGPDRGVSRRAAFEALRREALLANPLVCGQPILFVVRRQYRKDHHNTATMFQTGEINTASFEGGGSLKTIDLPTGTVTTVLDVPDGVVRDPDVSFDGRKILFSMRRNRDDDYHLYVIRADGTRLVQLTRGAGTSDIDPIYLPDGRICFTSTREPKYCMCNRHIMGNLYTMEADGANVQQIGHSTLHEGHPSLMPDGRIVYDRWEYVDRNFGDAQGAWSVNPDGTNHAVYWGNNTNSPGAVLDPRVLPDGERFVATFSSCHDRPWGAIALVDRRLGLDLKRPVIRTWPPEAIELVGKGNYDTFRSMKVKYEDPYPLSDKYFLSARMTGHGEEMGIYLLDVFGNEILLHAEAPGCYDPMPLAPRARPPVVTSRIDLTKDEGYFYVADVYQGTAMDRVARGSVKSLRVVESPEKRFWCASNWNGGTGAQAPGMDWDDFNNKRILGTVAVEPDGSAYFAVPADRFVYFQLLDDKGRMVQSMRSGTIVRPGETAGCVGCHEYRRGTASSPSTPLAMKRPARPLRPWYGPPRKFGYLAEVQPVFDRHCVSCHDYGKPEGEKLNLAGDLGLIFNTSYVELRSKDYVRVVGAGPSTIEPPGSWGSRASPLARVMLEGHGEPEIDAQVHLDRESIERVVTWIDINAPFYPEYAAVYPDNVYGRSPLDPDQMQRLGELAGVEMPGGRIGAKSRPMCTIVNFTRPELSPCLEGLSAAKGPAYREALAIIRGGQKMLAEDPNPGMPGFRLSSPADIAREAKYEARREAEARMRAAIAEGKRRYDP